MLNERMIYMPMIPLLLFSVLFTWGIGLGVPLTCRYVIFKKPISKKAAFCFSIAWLFIQLFMYVLLSSKSKTHSVLYLIAIISYYILIKGSEEADEKPKETKIKKKISKELSNIRNSSEKVIKE